MLYDTIIVILSYGLCEKFGGGVLPFTERTGERVFLTVKMETRHPIEGQFGREFPAICNHCVLMTA